MFFAQIGLNAAECNDEAVQLFVVYMQGEVKVFSLAVCLSTSVGFARLSLLRHA